MGGKRRRVKGGEMRGWLRVGKKEGGLWVGKWRRINGGKRGRVMSWKNGESYGWEKG